MSCLGLHGPKVSCLECGTPRPCLVTSLYDWMKLQESIVSLYKGDLTDWCGHALAVERTAAACGVSRRFVEKTLKKHKVIAS